MDTNVRFQRASLAWEGGDLKEAFRQFKAAAASGDGSSQHNLGYFYDAGEGIRANKQKALYWYKKAWLSDAQAGTCSNIASLYLELGNTRRAKFWLSRAIRLGDGDAMLAMAKMLCGSRVATDRRRVLALLKSALKAEQISSSGKSETSDLLSRLKPRGPDHKRN